MKEKKKMGLILMYLSFGIVMAGLGANDALRGVFSPIFKDHFTLIRADFNDYCHELCRKSNFPLGWYTSC